MTSATSSRPATRPLPGAPRGGRVFARTLAERMPTALLAGAGLAVMAAGIGAMYPSIRVVLADLELPESIMAMVGGADMTSPAGWINVEMLSIVAPAVVLAVAILGGARATAGEEEDRTLGLLLANPVSRTRVVLEKAAALLVALAVIGALTFAGLLAASPLGELDLSVAGAAAAGAHLLALGAVFAAAALAIGAVTGARRITALSTAGLAVLAYGANSFLPLSGSTAGWVRLSPWYYFTGSDPLANGVDWAHLAVLGAITVVLTMVAVTVFRRRDLRG